MTLPDVYLDSSAIFSALIAESGGARQLLRLGEMRHIVLCVSAAVLTEVENTLRSKAAAQLPSLALWLHGAHIKVVANASSSEVSRHLTLLPYLPDAVVLAAAVRAKVDFFVTLDRKHFLDNAHLRASLAFPLGTPGDCLAWQRVRMLAG